MRLLFGLVIEETLSIWYVMNCVKNPFLQIDNTQILIIPNKIVFSLLFILVKIEVYIKPMNRIEKASVFYATRGKLFGPVCFYLQLILSNLII